MTDIQKALLESYHHWEDNVKSYPWRGNANIKGLWFDENGLSEECALCTVCPGCEGCPLDDEGFSCAKEWDKLALVVSFGHSRLHHVEAVRDRLKTECEKEGLI